MIGSMTRQGNLFFAAFGSQAAKMKDTELDAIDELLDDDRLVSIVEEALMGRAPKNPKTGRSGMAPDQLLRCVMLKHIKQFSFRELEWAILNVLPYRMFARYDGGKIPSFSTLSQNFGLLGEEEVHRICDSVIEKARELGVATGRKMRTDTTVVETNIHHPADSSQLWDGIRVLTRLLRRLGTECAQGAVTVVDHARAVKRRLMEIQNAARVMTDVNREKMQKSYGKLLETARGVMRQTRRVLDQLKADSLPVQGNIIRVTSLAQELEHYVALLGRVIHQTKERIFRGDTHVPGKVLSIFEEHTCAIRKGKAHKPTEFGRLVRLDEVENGIISNYNIEEGNAADTNAFMPAIEAHIETFGCAPRLVTADRGFFSADNEKRAKEKGVQKVALPCRGKPSATRATHQKQPWFRGALRWRAAIEGRIGILKNCFGMRRALYKRERGFARYVGCCLIAQNLVAIARFQIRKGSKSNVT